MRKVLITIIVFVSAGAMAQHYSDYIQYMFNGVLFNPAYAGSQNALNLTALYGTQWVGIDGAPVSKSFSAHSPLKNKKLNVGLVIENQRFGVFDQTKLDLLYAYRLKLAKGHLALGLSGGFDINSANWNKIVTTDSQDPNFNGGATRTFDMQAGTGVYYNAERFYAGLASPQLFAHNSFNKYGTLILTSGFLSDISENFKLKPALLMRYIKGSPLAANVSATVYYKELIGVGVGYTHNSAAMFVVDAAITEQLRFGYGYNYALTNIRTYSSGSHEIMLRYLFSYKVRAVSSRYF